MTSFSLTVKETATGSVVNWKKCLCHKEGVTGELTGFSEKSWATFKNCAMSHTDYIPEKLSESWSIGPKGYHHRRCYQLYTNAEHIRRLSQASSEASTSKAPSPIKKMHLLKT